MWGASIVECSRSWCHKANFNIYLRYHAHKSNTNFWWKASYYLGQLRKLRIHVWIYNSCNYGFSILFLHLGHYCYRNSLQLDFHNCKLFWVGKRVPWQNPHMRTHLLVTFKFTFCHCYERRIVMGLIINLLHTIFPLSSDHEKCWIISYIFRISLAVFISTY